jgi:hypothetical protein
MDLPGLYRLHTLLKLYTPPNPHKDPFLVALVIALAQNERRHAPQPESHPVSFTVGRLLFHRFLIVPSRSTTPGREFKPLISHHLGSQVRLIFTGEGRPKSLNLYVAHVRTLFLDKLDFPGEEPVVNSGLDICHWHIPAEPFQTLPQRLCRALTLHCCGETHDSRVPGDSCETSTRSKRKRDMV